MPQLRKLPSERLRRQAKVLLVEDDYELRRIVAAVLRHDGYGVTELANGQELIDYMLSGPHVLGYEEPDVIVSDVCMPHRSGLHALERLRNAQVMTPVVLMSAFPEHCSNERANELGAVTLLEKPFELDDLRMIVLNLVPPPPRSRRGRHN